VPPTTLRVIAGGRSEQRADVDRWTNEGGRIAAEVAAAPPRGVSASR
jgi:hypothetical protein